MKKACKILLILGIVSMGIGIFFFLMYMIIIAGLLKSQSTPQEAIPVLNGVLGLFFIIMVVALGGGLAVQIIALNKLKVARSKSELTVIAILCLVLGNTIVGILMLCMKDEDLLVE